KPSRPTIGLNQQMPSATRSEVWLVDLGMVAKVRPALILSVPFRDHERAIHAITSREGGTIDHTEALVFYEWHSKTKPQTCPDESGKSWPVGDRHPGPVVASNLRERTVDKKHSIDA